MIQYNIYVATENRIVQGPVWALLFRDHLKLPGATVVGGIGHWENLTEISYTITILSDGHRTDRDDVEHFAEKLKEYFNQKTVLVSYHEVSTFEV